MSMHAILIRSTVLMVVALILAITATRQVPAANAQSMVTAHTAAPAAAVVDTRPIVELATIQVRPSAADLIAAQDDADETAGGGTLIDAAATDALYDTLTPHMPGLRMDMPYYSFGKVLRRGVKE
jgi:hypothetical protein